MQQFRLFGGSNFRFGTTSSRNLPLGVCLTPECESYINCQFFKVKVFASCPKCKVQLKFNRRAYKFMRKREKQRSVSNG